jgi:hypothetical protein
MAKLTREQHDELARLLNQAADNLVTATRIVGRAPFTDRALYVGGTLQEWLIDPLSEDRGGFDNPYQSIGYGGPHRRKKPPTTQCVPK